MTTHVAIQVADFTGGPLAIATEDGRNLHDAVATHLRRNQKVGLSFEGVTTLVPAFLSAAIGGLFSAFSEKRIHALLDVQDLHEDDQIVLDRVILNAKAYYANPKAFDEAWEMEGANHV